jgi:hypothetical protein
MKIDGLGKSARQVPPRQKSSHLIEKARWVRVPYEPDIAQYCVELPHFTQGLSISMTLTQVRKSVLVGVGGAAAQSAPSLFSTNEAGT